MLGENRMIVNEATAMQWLQRGLNHERGANDLVVTAVKVLRGPWRLDITVLTEAAWKARLAAKAEAKKVETTPPVEAKK